jgi:hypothetical protein
MEPPAVEEFSTGNLGPGLKVLGYSREKDVVTGTSGLGPGGCIDAGDSLVLQPPASLRAADLGGAVEQDGQEILAQPV